MREKITDLIEVEYEVLHALCGRGSGTTDENHVALRSGKELDDSIVRTLPRRPELERRRGEGRARSVRRGTLARKCRSK